MRKLLCFVALWAALCSTGAGYATDNLDWHVVDTIGRFKATFLHDGIFF